MYTHTKIKDFQVGDRFEHYSAIFEVTSDLKTWTNHSGPNDTDTVFGRSCKFISLTNGSTSADSLLKRYDWMQGVESVTYAKIK